MRSLPAALVLFLWCAAPVTVRAQLLPDLPLSVEVRVGVGIPTGDFAEQAPGVGAEVGPMFGVGATYHFMPGFAMYGGYSRTTFGCGGCANQNSGEDMADLDDSVVDSGASLGLQAAFPLPAAGLDPWVRAGGLVHELAFSGADGDLSSDRAFGFELGGGLSFSALTSLMITPAVRYRTYSAEFDFVDLPGKSQDVSQVIVDVGLSYRF